MNQFLFHICIAIFGGLVGASIGWVLALFIVTIIKACGAV